MTYKHSTDKMPLLYAFVFQKNTKTCGLEKSFGFYNSYYKI